MINVYAAFAGTGKTHLCTNHPDVFTEVECYKYDLKYFPNNYVVDIIRATLTGKTVFVSTNPIVLKELAKIKINVVLVYPDYALREEYIQRYKNRKSSPDFISMLDENWARWLTELQHIEEYEVHVLRSGEYLSKVINVEHMRNIIEASKNENPFNYGTLKIGKSKKMNIPPV